MPNSDLSAKIRTQYEYYCYEAESTRNQLLQEIAKTQRELESATNHLAGQLGSLPRLMSHNGIKIDQLVEELKRAESLSRFFGNLAKEQNISLD